MKTIPQGCSSVVEHYMHKILDSILSRGRKEKSKCKHHRGLREFFMSFVPQHLYDETPTQGPSYLVLCYFRDL